MGETNLAARGPCYTCLDIVLKDKFDSIIVLIFSLDCEQCDDFFLGECEKHKITYHRDRVSQTDGVPNSRSSLPGGLEIKQSNIFGAGLGVFALRPFKIDTVFGPYKGRKVSRNVDRDKVDTSYMWEVRNL